MPQFLIQFMEHIERVGMDTVGLYRLSGNMASVQKLRCLVEQGTVCVVLVLCKIDNVVMDTLATIHSHTTHSHTTHSHTTHLHTTHSHTTHLHTTHLHTTHSHTEQTTNLTSMTPSGQTSTSSQAASNSTSESCPTLSSLPTASRPSSMQQVHSAYIHTAGIFLYVVTLSPHLLQGWHLLLPRGSQH